jgi:CheY-like chemotaxis protein
MTKAAAGPLPLVLIVDDDPRLRMITVEAVEDAGFGTLQAADADEAVALLEAIVLRRSALM